MRKRTVFSALLLVGLVGLAVPARSQTRPSWSNDQEWLDYYKSVHRAYPEEARTSCMIYKKINMAGESIFDGFADRMSENIRNGYSVGSPSKDVYRGFLFWITGNYCPGVW